MCNLTPTEETGLLIPPLSAGNSHLVPYRGGSSVKKDARVRTYDTDAHTLADTTKYTTLAQTNASCVKRTKSRRMLSSMCVTRGFVSTNEGPRGRKKSNIHASNSYA